VRLSTAALGKRELQKKHTYTYKHTPPSLRLIVVNGRVAAFS
jgi:hypothetical protein